jgi:Transcription factor WhiB
MSHYTGAIPAAERAVDWRATAPCKAEPDAMFPGTNDYEIEYAKSFCRSCTAVDRCLQWALEAGEEHGVWGGLSEAQRRRIRRSPARQISVDDYIGITPTRVPAGSRTLQQHWSDGIQPDGEHLLWVGKKVIYRPEGGDLTPNRLAFFLDRGRWPEGDVKRMCGVGRCVRPAHLSDRVERAEEADLAVSA